MAFKSKGRDSKRIYYGWVIVGLVALVSFFQASMTLPVQSVFLKPLTDEFHWSRTAYTGALTIGTLLGGLISLGLGPLMDRYGGKWILVFSLAVLGISMIFVATVHSLWQFYAVLTVGRMATMGGLALAGSVIVPKWFISARGRAVSMSQQGLRFGNSLTPLFAQLLISVWSWRVAASAMGAAILAVSILPVALFMRRRPEDMGLLPDGRAATPQSSVMSKDGPSRKVQAEVSMSLRQVVKLPSFWLLVSSFTIGYIMFPGLNLHLVPYLEDKGLSPGVAVGVLALWSASGAIGALAFGFLADKFGARRMVTGNFLLVGLSFIFLLSVKSPHTAVLWGLYQGILQGGIFTLQQVLLANYYGRESLGAIRGMVWAFNMVANASGPLVASILYDATHTYVYIFISFGVLALVAGACVLMARPPAHVRGVAAA